jgi:hypothetical protein
VNAKPSPTDPTFVQVEVARDPELMRKIFQRHLRPLCDETYQVLECQISRAHYLKATRRILRYTLRLEESATGRERVELLTGVMYAEGGRARREWQELQRPGRAIPYALLTFEPFFYLAAMPLDSPLPRARAEGLTRLRRRILRTCSPVLARRATHPLRSRRPEESRHYMQEAESDTGLARQGRSPDQGGQ